MFMGKRWPVLVVVGSAIAYIGNNYRVGGLDQLRIEKRSSEVTGYPQGYPQGYSPGDQQYGQFPLPVNASQRPPSLVPGPYGSNKSLESIPPWQPQLSVGEKLAIMQDRLSEKIGELASPSGINGSSASNGTLPLSPPLDLPPGMLKNRPDQVLPSASSLGNSGMGLPGLSPGKMAGTSFSDGRVPSFRVASFCVQGLGATQLAKPTVSETLVSLLRQFEIVALQGIQSDRDDILPLIVERLNQTGRKYDYLIGPRVGPEASKQQFAFLFDASRVETDRYQLYTVDDPEALISFEPLVAWFRCREVPAQQAFTFTLVNIRVDPLRNQTEHALLANLIHAVVNDGRQEDDVIVLGDFSGNPASVNTLNVESIRHAIRDIPTDVSGEKMLSSILLPAEATCEYTGRSGVFDFLRKYNLSIERATEISYQMPVWAEFYVVEGAQPGRVAPPISRDTL